MTKFYTKIILVICALLFTESGSSASVFRSQIKQGTLPFDFWSEKSKVAKAICVKEPDSFARIDVRSDVQWSCNMPDLQVKPGDKLSLYAVVAGSISGEVPFDFEDNVPAFLRLGAIGRDNKGEVITWEAAPQTADAQFNGGQWKVLTVTFTVPTDVYRINPRVYGKGKCTVLISDLDMASANINPDVSMPAQDIVISQLGKKPLRVEILSVKADSEYYFYIYPNPIKIEFPHCIQHPNITYTCKVVDACGRTKSALSGRLKDGLTYKPDDAGYYELHIKATDFTAKEDVMYLGRVCFSSIREIPQRPAGSHPFGLSNNVKIAYLAGACWLRKGIFNNNWTYFDAPVNPDAIAAERKEMQKYRLAGYPLMKNLRPYTNNLLGPQDSPSWDNSGLPKDLEKFAEDYKTYASLENNFISDFEFDNEANAKINSFPWYNIQNYTNALIAANRGVKSANARARIGLCCAGVDLNFADAVNKNGGKDSYQILSIHPYTGYASGYPQSPEKGRMLDRSRGAREWLDSIGKKDCELWTTEYGWVTGSAPGAISELVHANYIIRGGLLQLAGGVTRILPFLDNDHPGWGHYDGKMGLTRVNKMPKPAFTAYAVLTRTIGDLPFCGRLILGEDIAALVFANDKKTVLAIWTPNKTKKYNFTLPHDGIRTEMFGARSRLRKGHYSSVCGESVQYLEFNKGLNETAKFWGKRFVRGLAKDIFTSAEFRDKTLRIPLISEADAPVIDGHIEGDIPGTQVELSDPLQGYLSTTGFLLTDSALYISARVLGKLAGVNANKNEQLWNGDCVELYWSNSVDDRQVGYYRKNIDFHVTVAPGDDGKNGKFGDISDRYGDRLHHTQAVVKYSTVLGGGYELEARIPLEHFSLTSIKPGDKFGFDVQLDVSDQNTKSRRLQRTWSGGENWESPLVWGRAVVVK